MAKKKQGIRVLLATLLLLLAAGGGWMGWRWQATLRCRAIVVSGNLHAHPDTLVALAHVDTSQMLFSIEPDLVADRVRRHPWVAAADVARYPTGTLAIRVQERVPVALVMDTGGAPAYYLDAEGYGMPLAAVAYDVPLLYGLRRKYHPLQPVEAPSARALLQTLSRLSPERDALLSSFDLDAEGDVWLRTAPPGRRDPIPVRLGRGDFDEKLGRLHAFWKQAVLPRPDVAFSLIDLRFNSQIVTREAAAGP